MQDLLNLYPNTQRITAVTPETTVFSSSDYISDRPSFSSPRLSQYEICTKRSHLKSLNHFLATDSNFLLTFEDDTLLNKNTLHNAITSVFKLLTTSSPDDNNIWHLGGMDGLKTERYFNFRAYLNVKLNLLELKVLYRLNAYLVTRKSAKKISDFFSYCNVVADDWEAIFSASKANIFYKQVFNHPTDLSSSHIESTRHGKQDLYYLVCPSFKRGGIEKNVILYKSALSSFGLNIQLLDSKHKVAEAAKNLNYSNTKSVMIIGFSSSHYCLYLALISRIKSIDTTSCFRLNNSPLSFIPEKSLKRFSAEIWKLVSYRFFDFLIATNMELRHAYRFHNKKIKVIRNPIQSTLPSFNAKSLSSPPFSCLFVGRLVNQKNIKNLFLAYQSFFSSHDVPQLHVYGDGPMRSLANDSIKLMGWSDVIPYTNYSHFILPSYYEGSPNALIEAIASDLSIITTPFGCGLNELLPFAKSSFVSSNFTSKALEKAIMQAFNSRFATDCHSDPSFTDLYSYFNFKACLKGIMR